MVVRLLGDRVPTGEKGRRGDEREGKEKKVNERRGKEKERKGNEKEKEMESDAVAYFRRFH
jgi:hypothetical protein